MSTAEPVQENLTRPGPFTPTPHNPTPTDSATIASGYDEQVDEIVDRLHQRYLHKQLSRADLESRVRGFYRQFDTARVRTYIAVFVERLARRSIDDPSLNEPATRAG